jgi:hypothetical protein
MSTSRPFAYNPSLLTLPGTINVGSICIGVDPLNVYVANYGGLTWWKGPDEELGYVIAIPVPSNTQPTPYPGVFASVGFWGTQIFASPFNESTFVNLVNVSFGQTFTMGFDASYWLFSNGYWTNYLPIRNIDAYNYAAKVILLGAFLDFPTMVALDQLFYDLQDNGMYSQLTGFYPMLGETSATQAINGNLNPAYDLNFYGGWTFDVTGAKGNGINTYAAPNMFYSGYDLQNTHFSIYGTSPGNIPSNYADLAIINFSQSNMDSRISLNNYGTNDGRYEYVFYSSSGVYPADSGDFVLISNDGSATYRYQNEVAQTTLYESPVLGYTAGLYLGISRYSGNNQISTNSYGWASFGGTLPDLGKYQNIVNTFMTSIGRNSY